MTKNFYNFKKLTQRGKGNILNNNKRKKNTQKILEINFEK